MEFTIPAAAFPLGSVFENLPEVTIELERLIPHETLTIPYFWVRGTETREIEAAFEPHAGVTDIQLVDSVDDEYLMRAEWVREYDGLMSALSETDLTVLSGVGTDAGWRFEVRADTQKALSSFRTYHLEHDIPVDIATIHALLPIQGESYALTETQREALVLAYEGGYFDTPRESSLEEIASQLDLRPPDKEQIRRMP